MSVSIGGSKHKDKGSSALDPKTTDYMEKVRQAGIAAGESGPSPLVTDAAGYNSGLMKAGNLGMGALSGNTADASAMMNPYQQKVIDAANAQWNQTDQQSMNAVNDRATMAGAFGGSRHGVATGTALAQNNLNRNSQIGGLLYQGFGDTMNRAGMMAGMGFQGAGANANLGMGGVGNPDQWKMEMMKRGYMGPYGGTTAGSGYGLGFSATRPSGVPGMG